MGDDPSERTKQPPQLIIARSIRNCKQVDEKKKKKKKKKMGGNSLNETIRNNGAYDNYHSDLDDDEDNSYNMNNSSRPFGKLKTIIFSLLNLNLNLNFGLCVSRRFGWCAFVHLLRPTRRDAVALEEQSQLCSNCFDSCHYICNRFGW